jgi:hypothetical protein
VEVAVADQDGLGDDLMDVRGHDADLTAGWEAAALDILVGVNREPMLGGALARFADVHLEAGSDAMTAPAIDVPAPRRFWNMLGPGWVPVAVPPQLLAADDVVVALEEVVLALVVALPLQSRR